jgi:lon-related putative ATP-dependent protease
MLMATTMERLELTADQLRRRLEAAELPFETTAEVEPLEGTIGQPRALDALVFGLEIGTFGYNLFAAGAPGSGRESTVRHYLERFAADRPSPDDWVYVHNFADADRPDAISLPAGRGRQFARDMDEFIAAAREDIPRTFESEEYERRRSEALAEFEPRREHVRAELQRFARERGYALEQTPAGIASMPLVDDRPLSPEELERLSPDERQDLERRGEEIKERVGKGLRELRRLEKEAAERTRELDREIALFAVGPLLEDLREKYADLPEILTYLERVGDDLPNHLPDFRPEQEEHGQGLPLARLQGIEREEHLARYRVNFFVDNATVGGAPVVIERNPTYYNLIGRINYRAAFGAMVTDFHQIKAGALQRANGGFLVLHVLEVLRNPFAWQALKRSLLDGEVRIENLAEQFSPIPTATLRPEPVPLDVKVVLIGQPLLYHLLYLLDEDFRELFKVKVDFAPEMEWGEEHVGNYAAFVSRCVRSAGLKHFHSSAVARVVEYGARLREHQGKLSTRLLEISDVVSEASFWATKAGHEVVLAEDVDRAIAKKEYRSNQLEERIQELIGEGTVMIDVDGTKPAQVNGLSIIELGDYRFGRPARVTARVSLGRGTVESIEREIELSGPIHSKGFLILSGYLAEKYAQEWPLALKATIAFEQSYDEVEGDSASSTELYALLSALSGLPLRQGIAVTGSVNQHGEVQAVGGVTRKVEGFFASCQAKGLTGEQGVLIPAANARHLMLADEVLEAVERGEFHLWAVRTIDEGIELLTGRVAGARGDDGSYPAGSVHALVEERLRTYAERLRAFASTDGFLAGQPADIVRR